MHHMKGALRRMSIPLTCALLLTMGGFSVSLAFAAQQAVANVGLCPTLSKGSTDTSTQGKVSILQKKLQDAGETLGASGPNHNGVDGIFGSTTRAAVISYQGKHGLGADGVVGPLTWEKLGGCSLEQQPTPIRSSSLYTLTIVHLYGNRTNGPADPMYDGLLQATFQDYYPQLVQNYALDPAKAATHVTLRFDPNSHGFATADEENNLIIANPAQAINDGYRGWLVHELTHEVQQYVGKNVPPSCHWVAEGLADYAAWQSGQNPARWYPPLPTSANSYIQGYTTDARFFLWIQAHYSPTIVSQVNHACQTGQAPEPIFAKVTGKALDSLWTEYVANPDLTIRHT